MDKWTAFVIAIHSNGRRTNLKGGLQMPETQLAPSTRRSGIELLKIAAILLIVISHITQTMNAPNPDIAYSGYLIDLDSATRSLQTFVLILFRHFGVLGNTVFFICSAWFLLESDKFRKKKWFFMLSEIWFVSVVILCISEMITRGALPFSIVIKSLFPTAFNNNRYLTRYLLFYPIHPALNPVIGKMSQKSLFRTALFSFLGKSQALIRMIDTDRQFAV